MAQKPHNNRKFVMKYLSLLFIALIFFAHLNASAPAADIWWPGPDYPGPDKASTPEWLLTQKLNFSRWDGGPLEVCKGMLSGWPYFNAPWPDVVDVTSRWYYPETVELVEATGYNFIWLTVNVGYSIEKERHRPKYIIGRCCNIISTEDGYEPGYYRFRQGHEIRSTDALKPVWEDVFVDIEKEPFESEMLVTNLGRLRLLKGLDEGWKPVIVEFGGRRNGHRFLNHYPPLGFQLAIGECNAALASLQGFQEGLPLLHLYERKPEVMKIVEATNKAHQFVRKHQEYFLGARYKADVAFVTDDRLDVFSGNRPREGFLTDLIRANVQFDVLFEDRISKKNLRRYQCIVVYNTRLISDEALAVLISHAREGGRMIAFGQTAAMDRWGQPRQKSFIPSAGLWRTARSEAALLDFIRESTTPSFEVIDCPYVLFTITEAKQSGKENFAVHLLNYRKHPLVNVRVRCPGVKKLYLLSLTPGCDRIRKSTRANEWVIPKLGVYSILAAKG